LTVNLNFLQYFVCLHGRINYINWCITLRLCTVVCLRRMQVGAWGQSPSLLVWRHHMRHAVVQNSSGRQVVWCRRTAALEQVACFTAVIWQSQPIQKTVENVFVCQGLGYGA